MTQADFNEALTALRNAKARKRQAREKFNAQLADLKAEREAEAQKWKTKKCECKCGCNKEIRYRIDWSNIPKFCKDCRDEQRRKRRETICVSCGDTFFYNADRIKIPKFCT